MVLGIDSNPTYLAVQGKPGMPPIIGFNGIEILGKGLFGLGVSPCVVFSSYYLVIQLTPTHNIIKQQLYTLCLARRNRLKCIIKEILAGLPVYGIS